MLPNRAEMGRKKKRKKKIAQPGLSAAPVRRRRVPIAFVGAAAAAALAAAALMLYAKNSSSGPSPSPAASLSVATAPAVAVGRQLPSQGNEHNMPLDRLEKFAYNSDPPTSGPHLEVFSDGFVSQRPLPKYMQVHFLEHANVLLQYNCVCPDVAAALAQIAAEYDDRLLPPGRTIAVAADVSAAAEQGVAVVVAPYPGMRRRIALTAWRRLLELDGVDKAQIVTFVNQYLNNHENAKP